MDTDEAVKAGYLFVPGQGFLKKSWNKRYYALHRSSNHGIQRLEVFENEENSLRQSPLKIIPLTDCIKVNSTLQKNQSNVFEVRTKEHVHVFSADSFQEMTDWLACIQSVAFGCGTKPVLCPSLSQSESSSIMTPPINTHHEENLIYSSVDAPEVYPVTVIESDATTRCKLSGSYQLMVTSMGITLSQTCLQTATKAIQMWSYRHIRRYGYSHSTFSFEAGRKATSGEGLFTFNTKDGATIFQSIATRVESLKTSKGEVELSNSPSPYTTDDKGFFASPEFSNRNVNQSNDQRYGLINISTTPGVKPPRRSKLKMEKLPSLPLDNSNTNVYEDPALIEKEVEGDYDEPEERHEAWKTLGQDAINPYSTYEDLNYASIKVERIIPTDKHSISKDHVKSLSNSLPRTRNSIPSASMLYGKVQNKNNAIFSASGPDYENLQVSSNGSPPTYSSLDERSTSPQRILCNDAEYAQIIRKKK